MNKLIPLLLTLILFLSSCLNDPGSREYAVRSGQPLLSITGAAGEVLVVLENSAWKGDPGNALREALEQEYPALPQMEPLFDVIHITAGAFDAMFKAHRTIIVVDISRQNEKPEIRYSDDVWAQPQLVVNINAPDTDSFIDLISSNKDKLVNTLLVYDRNRIGQVLNENRDASIKNILTKFNVDLTVPRGYNVDINTDDFISLSIETTQTSQVLFVYRYPYRNEKDLSSGNLIAKRNEFLRKYTKGTRQDSYMTTASLPTPIVYDLNRGGKKTIEIRGLWELHNGYMGGPFISHTKINEKAGEVVTVEGYVYNPGDKKRPRMRQMEAIVYSFQLIQ